MKMFGITREQNEKGYKSKIYFFWIPIIKKIREQGNRRIYLFGIKVYHKKIKTPKPVCDKNYGYVTEILIKTLEKNLREMKQFEKETKERLAEIEKKLK